ncbi:hypothetical protein N24_2864 [Corynebacterium suranareeae]|uniref:Uncharacterized protein n=1 Tax=Corynebacterium suranareeae TaxID=2506452 RepID=A0A169S4E7_9CORY|nr:hypothetical protein [Corynebacterium suranareeae]BAU97126.1 hypothetical protein N24_2864 [Corynebacterium suranareeae]
MEISVLIIAALILVAGIMLWRADSAKQTAKSAAPQAEKQAPVETAVPEIEPEPEPKPEPELEPEPEPDHAQDIYFDDSPELDTDVEDALAELPEVEEVPETPEASETPEALEPPENQDTPEVVADEEHRGVDKHSFLSSFPGSQRRERKNWAAKHHFDFIKEDAFLTDEWSRGAASTGAVARDVVSGMAEGYETHLVDLAGVPVMAMRRGITSDVVIDARRGEQPNDPDREESDDLVEVDTVSGFRLLSNVAGVAQRFVDERIRVGLDAMPEAVTAVWMESDWVLAETIKGSTPADWEDILQPLALLTDASFTLPPRSARAHSLELKHFEPSRLKPEEPEKPEFVPNASEEDLSQPLVIRPEEPLQMPVRGVQESRGVVEPCSLGADDVESIAEGDPERPNDLYGTRVVRDLNGQSSIFKDSDDTDEPPTKW